MKYQIVWILVQIAILWIVWAGTRIQIKKGEKTVVQASGVIIGTITYLFINNLILFMGGFFDVIIAKIF